MAKLVLTLSKDDRIAHRSVNRAGCDGGRTGAQRRGQDNTRVLGKRHPRECRQQLREPCGVERRGRLCLDGGYHWSIERHDLTLRVRVLAGECGPVVQRGLVRSAPAERYCDIISGVNIAVVV